MEAPCREPMPSDCMSRYARSDSTAYLSDQHVNLIEGVDLVIPIRTHPIGRRHLSGRLRPILANWRSRDLIIRNPIAAPPDAFSKVRTLVDFLAGRFASEPEWGSGASVDHAVAISCE